MKLLYQQVPALPITSVSLVLPRTGVCLDPPRQRGATRLMGRLQFMGAGGMDNLEINGRLERLGASMVSTGLKSYLGDCGRYPTTEQGLGALQEPPQSAPHAHPGPGARRTGVQRRPLA